MAISSTALKICGKRWQPLELTCEQSNSCSDIRTTVRYLRIEVDDAIEIVEKIDI